MLDSVGVREVRREGGGTDPAGKYVFFYGKGNDNLDLCTCLFVHKKIVINS
jgi:hypothetical protein